MLCVTTPIIINFAAKQLKTMKKIYIIILFVILSYISKAQNLKVEIISDNSELIFCPKTSNTINVKTTLDGEQVAADYVWDFDNGDRYTSHEDFINYRYSTGGAYIISVKANYNNMSASTKINVKVPQAPNFDGYKNDIKENQLGICLGETVKLSMPINNTTTEYHYRNYYKTVKPESFYFSTWTNYLVFKNFDSKTINSKTDIKSVWVKLVHDNSQNLQIKLTSPDNKELILKGFGEVKNSLGIPEEGNTGTLYKYIFTNEASKTINSVTESEISAGEYLPEESFEKLIGSPINGEWTISLESQGDKSEGHISEWGIELNEDIVKENIWDYDITYDLRRAVWSGNGVSATSQGIADCIPKDYGSTKYTFLISDNYSCYHDTAVFVEVEKPSFKGSEGETIFIGDEIEFESTTSWAKEYLWTFGDETKGENNNPAPHAYYEKGNYQAIFEATSENGCRDRDTQTVKIIPMELEIKEVNIFTPNGDGQNDVFTFFDREKSFLKNGGLTKMPANIRSIKGKIYNSYGQTIYKWNEIEPAIFGWDGTIDNKGSRECPPGTYFYDIIVQGKDGNSVKRSGSIYLYRSK